MMKMLKKFCKWFWNWLKKFCKWFWNWKINLIRQYPIWCAYAAWLEGIIIGLLIYHYFLMEKLSCCGMYG